MCVVFFLSILTVTVTKHLLKYGVMFSTIPHKADTKSLNVYELKKQYNTLHKNKIKLVSCVIYHVSPVTCPMSPVTCHMSPVGDI